MHVALKLKLLASVFAFLFCMPQTKSQAPQAIPYQAAARTSFGTVLTNKPIGLRFSVRDLSATGTIVYRETQNATTNMVGMFLVNIGQGTSVSGTFHNINWSSGSKFLQVEIDTAGGNSNYIDLGTQQLLSVPYALSTGNGVPVGTVVAFMGNTPPPGWLICDGAAISRTNYSALFGTMGTASGSGDGSTTFNLPDLRGMFLRGRDGTAGNDPDKLARTGVNGGNTGNAIGSLQPSGFALHQHAEAVSTNTNASNGIFGAIPYPSSSTTGNIGYGVVANTAWQVPPQVQYISLTSATGSSTETRPTNVYVNYIIKF
jgi:microcystin-dependent protein